MCKCVRLSTRGSGNKRVSSNGKASREQLTPVQPGWEMSSVPVSGAQEFAVDSAALSRGLHEHRPPSVLFYSCLSEQGKKKLGSQLPSCTVHSPFENKKWSLVISEKLEIYLHVKKQLIIRGKDCQAVNQTTVLAVWFIFYIVYAALTIFPRSSITQQISLCTSLGWSGPLGDVASSLEMEIVSCIPFITPVSVMVSWVQNNRWWNR